ncbi:MAG TPA: hypothetical protein VHP32_06500 [Ignavibacteria bacterium]|nr:hypothetical protein [Ignavibacteria bacterium]
MLKLLGKYFIPSLAILLILSNFSYATNLMACSMNNDNSCECSHTYDNKTNELNYHKTTSGCCSEKTSELSNSNTLSISKTDLPKEIHSLGVLIVIPIQSFVSQNISMQIDKGITGFHKQDIPIFISSLLI